MLTSFCVTLHSSCGLCPNQEVANISLSLLDRSCQTGENRCVEMTVADAVHKHKLINNETLAYFMARTHLFLLSLGIKREKLRFRQHLSNEMAHYASDCKLMNENQPTQCRRSWWTLITNWPPSSHHASAPLCLIRLGRGNPRQLRLDCKFKQKCQHSCSPNRLLISVSDLFVPFCALLGMCWARRQSCIRLEGAFRQKQSRSRCFGGLCWAPTGWNGNCHTQPCTYWEDVRQDCQAFVGSFETAPARRSLGFEGRSIKRTTRNEVVRWEFLSCHTWDGQDRSGD